MSKTSLVMATDPKDTPQLPEVNKKDFWQILLNGVSPNENVYAVLSAKQGVEWVGGKPTGEWGHTALLSYNEVAAFLTLEQELQQIKERLILVHGGIKDSHSGGTIVPEFRKDGTLIIIGSSNANKLCQRILSLRTLPRLPFCFGVNENGKKCIHVYQDEKNKWSDLPLVSFPSLVEEGAPVQVDLSKLRQILTARFDEGELRSLCFDLGIDYDNLPGEGKANKARELLAHLERRKQIPKLVQVGKQLRLDISWDDTLRVAKETLPELLPSLKDKLDNKDMLEEDFGIVLRITNPIYASGKNKVLILGGNHGFGTASAVGYVADKERMKQLTDIVQDQDFEILFQAFVSGNDRLPLGIRKLAVLEDGEWRQRNVP